MKIKNSVNWHCNLLLVVALVVAVLGFAYAKPVLARDLRTFPIPGSLEKSGGLSCMGTIVADFYEEGTNERLVIIPLYKSCRGNMTTFEGIGDFRRMVVGTLVNFLLYSPADPSVYSGGMTLVKSGDAVKLIDYIGYQVRVGSDGFTAAPDMDQSWRYANVIGPSYVRYQTNCRPSGCDAVFAGPGFYSIDLATSSLPGSAVLSAYGDKAGILVGSDPESGRSLVMGADAIWAELGAVGLIQRGRSNPAPEPQ